MGLTDALTSATGEQGDFVMKMLITQLQHQDPTEPMSNTEMVTQMSQLATLETLTGLKQTFSDVLELQMLASGAGLIGRQVEFEYEDGRYTGLVEAVNTAGDEMKLVVGGMEVPLTQVTAIL